MNKLIMWFCVVFLSITSVHAAMRDINITFKNHLTASIASISLIVMPANPAEIPAFIEPALKVVLAKKTVDPVEEQRTISILEGQAVIADFSLFYWGPNRQACNKSLRFMDLGNDQVVGLEFDIQVTDDGAVEMNMQPLMA